MRSHIDKAAKSAPGDADAAGGRAASAEAQEDPKEAGHSGARGAPAAPLGDMVGFALRTAQLAVFDEAVRCLAELDLRPAQATVLALIGHRPGLKQSEAATFLHIQRANIVTLIDGLEQRGLARRKPIPSDRRSHALHLTAEGARAMRRASAIMADIEARIDAKLGSGGREQLLDMLWRLARE